jgi:APA family basic amino acid/polyamine antiporter
MWVFYALITGSIFVYRRKFPHLERPYRAWGYPVVPIIFILVAVWLLVTTFASDLQSITAAYSAGGGMSALAAFGKTSSFTGSFMVLLGLPVYYYLTKRRGSETEENNADQG